MDYGYPGFEIHQILNPRIFDGFDRFDGYHGFDGFDRFDGYHGFDGLDMNLISVFHMDMDWIWINGSVEDGLWIGYGSRFQSIRPHCPPTYNIASLIASKKLRVKIQIKLL